MVKKLPKDTNFVVSGLARTGTTYMMRCLEAGELSVVSQSWRYEIRNQDAKPIDPNKWKGMCFKHFAYRLIKYDPSNMAIIYMRRNPYKIITSCIRFGAKVHPWVVNCRLRYGKNQEPRGWEFDVRPYEENRIACAKIWRKKALSYVECTLENMDTYKKRLKFFQDLVEEGWPINPEKAAAVTNDETARIRRKGRPVLWT